MCFSGFSFRVSICSVGTIGKALQAEGHSSNSGRFKPKTVEYIHVVITPSPTLRIPGVRFINDYDQNFQLIVKVCKTGDAV
jgi:hypothetical protein